MLRQQLLDTSRGRIVALLQQEALTVDDIASKLDLTPNAVRAHLTAMERDGLVQRTGRRAGTTRPSNVFELTAEVEQLLSRAYLPFLRHIVDVLANTVDGTQVERLMREVGKSLAADITLPVRPSATLRARVSAASEFLNKQLGAVTHVEANGKCIIRGMACPLAALTGKHPAVCLALEALLTEVIGTDVHECCDRTGRPKCCFEMNGPAGRHNQKASRKRHGSL